MPDVNERLDRVEEGLTKLGQRMDEQFAKVDERFAQVDERFAKVDERFAKIDERFEALTSEVRQLRVLGEENSSQIKLIAEVQVHHGEKLDQLVRDIEPLKVLPGLFTQIAQNHERRITALEQARQ
jgi:archaellum component FlaC